MRSHLAAWLLILGTLTVGIVIGRLFCEASAHAQGLDIPLIVEAPGADVRVYYAPPGAGAWQSWDWQPLCDLPTRGMAAWVGEPGLAYWAKVDCAPVAPEVRASPTWESTPTVRPPEATPGARVTVVHSEPTRPSWAIVAPLVLSVGSRRR